MTERKAESVPGTRTRRHGRRSAPRHGDCSEPNVRSLNHAAYALTLAFLACGSASKPRVDTPETLPPAEPPADLSRAPAAAAADAGKPEGAGGEPGGR